MPTGQEILNSVFGAYRLALLDASALRWFSVSVPGFWRSFTSALVVAPPFALIVALRFDPQSTTVESYWLVESVTYALGWAVFPIVMVPVCWALSLGGHYITYIIVYNWSAVVQVGAILPVVIVDAAGMLPAMVSTLLGLLVTGALLFYQWFIGTHRPAGSPATGDDRRGARPFSGTGRHARSRAAPLAPPDDWVVSHNRPRRDRGPVPAP